MTRASILFVAAATCLSLSVVTGCDRASSDQDKANSAQAEANKKIGEAKNEAANKANGAQAEADKKIAAAEADFGKLREDYRHKLQSDLIDIDKKIDLLDAKAKTATGKAKADLDANLLTIRAKRSAFAADVKSVEVATAPTWSDTKARIEKDFSELKSTVEKA